MKANDFWHTMVNAYLDNADLQERPRDLAQKATSFASEMLYQAREVGMIAADTQGAPLRPRLRVPWGGVVLPSVVNGAALDRDRRLLVQIGEGTYLRSPETGPEVLAFGEQLIEAAQLYRLCWGLAGVRLRRVTAAGAERGQVQIELRGGGYIRSPPIGDPLATRAIAELEAAMAKAGLVK